MSALSSALPLALSAAIYPPALLVLLLLLTGDHPRRLVLAYFAGAALDDRLRGSDRARRAEQLRRDDAEQPIGQRRCPGRLRAAVARAGAWLWRRRSRHPDKPEDDEQGKPGRIAEWSQRATTSQKWSFVLGLAMFLPSPLYLLAVQQIADSGSSSSSDILAVLICAMGVLIFVEITVVALFVRPGRRRRRAAAHAGVAVGQRLDARVRSWRSPVASTR